MLNDLDRIRIQRIIARCQGICDIGDLFHRLWSDYLRLEKAEKDLRQEVWKLTQKKMEGENEND